jgi:hypothetical protein
MFFFPSFATKFTPEVETTSPTGVVLSLFAPKCTPDFE